MVSSRFLVIKSSSHVDFGIAIQVELGKITVVRQLFAFVLKIIICEEAGVNVLGEKLSELNDELILNHFQFDFSVVEIYDLDVY